MIEAVPVLIIGYNRLDFLQTQIQNCMSRGRRVYLAVDGPKNDHDFEAQEVLRFAKSLVASSPEWLSGCLIRESNLGCREGVSTAIDWVFQQTTRIIILEDDVITTSDFFEYMDLMLQMHEYDEEIFVINAWSAVPLSLLPPEVGNQDFFRSVFSYASGWGTWANRWGKVDIELGKFTKKSRIGGLPTIKKLKANVLFRHHFHIKLKQCLSGLDTWDYPLLYSMWFSGGLAITPVYRKSGNIGFDDRATHTKQYPEYINREYWDLPVRKDWNSSSGLPKEVSVELSKLFNNASCVSLLGFPLETNLAFLRIFFSRLLRRFLN